jgi:O-antigen ligase
VDNASVRMAVSSSTGLARPRFALTAIDWREPVVAVGAFALVAGAAAAQGGYFPTAWGWIALALAWTVGLALVLQDEIQWSIAESVAVAALTAFLGWVALSTIWSNDVPQSIFEVERTLLYPLAVLAALLLVRRRQVGVFLVGALAAITVIATYALGRRLFPRSGEVFDVVTQARLSEPIGYWNGLAIFTVVGILLALGFAARGKSSLARALAAATLPILATTLYFTYSRGGWIALAVAIVVAVLVDPRRLQLLVTMIMVAGPAAVSVLLASRSEALTNLQVPHDELAHDGKRLAPIILGLVAASFLLALVQTALERRLPISRAVRVAGGLVAASAAAAALVALFVAYGSPDTLARRGYHSFMQDRAPAKAVSQPAGSTDLNDRLFTLRSNGRRQTWAAAWHEFEGDRWTGSGAGDFGRYWLQHRAFPLTVSDAHSLYLETLGELGPLGLALLVVGLGLPLAIGVGARRDPLVPCALAAYAGFLAHAGVDWDWELPAVMFAGLLCGAALLVAGRRGDAHTRPRVALQVVIVALLVAAAGFSVVTLVGNRALAKSTAAVDAADWQRGQAQAHTAIRWLPWSGEAWRNLGDAQLGLGQRAEARRSLAKAVRLNPGDWKSWFDLGTAERGVARRRAYIQAAQRNPLNVNIVELRRRHTIPAQAEEGG